MKKIVSLFFIVVFVLLVGCTYAESQMLEQIQLFTEDKVDIRVVNQGETVIALDIGDNAFPHIKSKSKSDKCFLHYIDWNGLHIIPVSKGTGSITITSTDSPKDKTTVNVIIDEKAVPDKNGPLSAYAVYDSSFQTSTKNAIGKFFIVGGKSPYQCNYTIHGLIGNATSGEIKNFEFKASNSVGSLKLYKSYSPIIQGILTVTDANQNSCIVKTNPVITVSDVQFALEFMPYAMKVGTTVKIPYHITGGSGSYNLNRKWDLRSKDMLVLQSNKEKIKSGEDGYLEFSPNSEGSIQFSIYTDDNKAKQSTSFDSPFIQVGKPGLLKLYVDKQIVKAGDNITVTVETDGFPISDIISIMALRSCYEDKELITDSLDGELKQVDETHYEAVIKTPDKVYGYMMIYMALKDCANCSAGFQIAVIP